MPPANDTLLKCYVSHWLGAYLDWSLCVCVYIYIYIYVYTGFLYFIFGADKTFSSTLQYTLNNTAIINVNLVTLHQHLTPLSMYNVLIKVSSVDKILCSQQFTHMVTLKPGI